MTRRKATTGRPSKLTPEITSRVAKIIRAGAYMEAAAAWAGVSKVTLYAWMNQGARDIEAGYSETPAADFLNAVKKAMAESEIADLRTISAAAEAGIWQAAAWRLERKHPLKWGRRHPAVTDKNGDPGQTQQATTYYTPEQVRNMAQKILAYAPSRKMED